MKPIHVKSSTYFDFHVENNNKDYNFPSVFFLPRFTMQAKSKTNCSLKSHQSKCSSTSKYESKSVQASMKFGLDFNEDKYKYLHTQLLNYFHSK